VGGLTVRGSYEFVDEDGKVRKVNYIADEKGFQPTIVD
jgi:Insect cuticle protein